jgi:hypothetical protein
MALPRQQAHRLSETPPLQGTLTHFASAAYQSHPIGCVRLIDCGAVRLLWFAVMITSAWRRPLTTGLAAPRSRVHAHGPNSHSARDLDRAEDLARQARELTED